MNITGPPNAEIHQSPSIIGSTPAFEATSMRRKRRFRSLQLMRVAYHGPKVSRGKPSFRETDLLTALPRRFAALHMSRSVSRLRKFRSLYHAFRSGRHVESGSGGQRRRVVVRSDWPIGASWLGKARLS
jgi:hypothetical protein